MKKLLHFYKIERPSTDLQPCLQTSQNSFCHGVVLKIHNVVERQIYASFAVKMKTVE